MDTGTKNGKSRLMNGNGGQGSRQPLNPNTRQQKNQGQRQGQQQRIPSMFIKKQHKRSRSYLSPEMGETGGPFYYSTPNPKKEERRENISAIPMANLDHEMSVDDDGNNTVIEASSLFVDTTAVPQINGDGQVIAESPEMNEAEQK